MFPPDLRTLGLQCAGAFCLGLSPLAFLALSQWKGGMTPEDAGGQDAAPRTELNSRDWTPGLFLLLEAGLGFLPVHLWKEPMIEAPRVIFTNGSFASNPLELSLIALAVMAGIQLWIRASKRGSTGVAAFAGSLIAFEAELLIWPLGLLILVLLFTRRPSISILAGVIAVPAVIGMSWQAYHLYTGEFPDIRDLPFDPNMMYVHGGYGRSVVLSWSLIALFVIIRYRGNIRRLLNGTEPRLRVTIRLDPVNPAEPKA